MKVNPNDLTQIVRHYKPLNGEELAYEDKGGMSIRTELAARAMQGFASNSYWGKTMEWEEYRDRLVKASVDLADSLIKELNKPTE